MQKVSAIRLYLCHSSELDRAAMKLELYVPFGRGGQHNTDSTIRTATNCRVIAQTYWELTVIYRATEQQPYIRTYTHKHTNIHTHTYSKYIHTHTYIHIHT